MRENFGGTRATPFSDTSAIFRSSDFRNYVTMDNEVKDQIKSSVSCRCMTTNTHSKTLPITDLLVDTIARKRMPDAFSEINHFLILTITMTHTTM